MGLLTLIIVPVLVYWIKLGVKFNKKEGQLGLKRYFIQLVLMLLFIAGLWWFALPDLSADKAIHLQPKGLLFYVLTLIVSVSWPIIMEFRLDKRIKKG